MFSPLKLCITMALVFRLLPLAFLAAVGEAVECSSQCLRQLRIYVRAKASHSTAQQAVDACLQEINQGSGPAGCLSGCMISATAKTDLLRIARPLSRRLTHNPDAPASDDVCSEACLTELSRCVSGRSSSSSVTYQEAADFCLEEINRGVGPLHSAGCVPQCVIPEDRIQQFLETTSRPSPPPPASSPCSQACLEGLTSCVTVEVRDKSRGSSTTRQAVDACMEDMRQGVADPDFATCVSPCVVPEATKIELLSITDTDSSSDPAVECSQACLAEMTNCVEFAISASSTAQQALNNCQRDINQGAEPLSSAGCVSGCVIPADKRTELLDTVGDHFSTQYCSQTCLAALTKCVNRRVNRGDGTAQQAVDGCQQDIEQGVGNLSSAGCVSPCIIPAAELTKFFAITSSPSPSTPALGPAPFPSTPSSPSASAPNCNQACLAEVTNCVELTISATGTAQQALNSCQRDINEGVGPLSSAGCVSQCVIPAAKLMELLAITGSSLSPSPALVPVPLPSPSPSFTFSPDCSQACLTQLTKCVASKVSRSSTAQEALDACQRDIDQGVEKLVSAGCVSLCVIPAADLTEILTITSSPSTSTPALSPIPISSAPPFLGGTTTTTIITTTTTTTTPTAEFRTTVATTATAGDMATPATTTLTASAMATPATVAPTSGTSNSITTTLTTFTWAGSAEAVTGSFALQVEDANMFISDPNAELVARKAVAAVADVEPFRVTVSLKLENSRRLPGRAVKGTGVLVDYSIAVPSIDVAADVKSKIISTDLVEVKQAFQDAASAAGLPQEAQAIDVQVVTEPSLALGPSTSLGALNTEAAPDSMPTMLIVAIAVGGAVLLGVMGTIVACYLARRKTPQAGAQGDGQDLDLAPSNAVDVVIQDEAIAEAVSVPVAEKEGEEERRPAILRSESAMIRGWELQRVADGSDTLNILASLLHVPDPRHLGVGKDVRERAKYNKLTLRCAWRILAPSREAKYRLEVDEITLHMKMLEHHGHSVPSVPTILDSQAGLLGVDQSANEKMLLHGTKPELLPSILQTGLNERYTSVGLFGLGLYLAEDPSKTDQYCTPDMPDHVDMFELHEMLYSRAGVEHPERSSGSQIFYQLVCRVALGCPVFTKDGHVSIDDPARSVYATPDKRECAAIPGSSPPIPHHSLIAEKGPLSEGYAVVRHREFVQFHSQRVLPEYLIAYTRDR
eukprot:TRINITY_DN2024_c0_g2_i2.p1 TRINITY_DN2024_c0_g2~~TRINITY_DN2024_c0_g2_i2.p1  ORF type:complete len:1198 (-),score=131.25 TRINITY_DN2024_c0_g2_i2:132-3725(-)